MAGDVRGWIRRRTPGIGWREERLAERAAEVADLRRRLAAAEQDASDLRGQQRQRDAAGAPKRGRRSAQPSFRRHLLDLRRCVEELRPLDPGITHPVLQVPRKLRNYRLAASHGVSVPSLFGVWAGLEEIDLADLPEEFVLKSDSGAGGRGVLPLRREGAGAFRILGGEQTFTRDEVLERYRSLGHLVGGPYFAEQVLRGPAAGPLPDDIKIYAFYGEVGQVLLRRMDGHADLTRAGYRYLDGTGDDLGPDAAPGRRIDPTIPVPERLGDYLEIARHLSRAVALPFIRVDVYETADGPVLGELTRAPGGPQRYRSDHDRAMGRQWDLAQLRLDLDVVSGRPLQHLHGAHPAPDPYPPDAPTVGPDRPPTVSCQDWCEATLGALPADL